MELMRMGILLVVGGVVAFFLFQIGIVCATDSVEIHHNQLFKNMITF
jgi:hypothetical protein